MNIPDRLPNLSVVKPFLLAKVLLLFLGTLSFKLESLFEASLFGLLLIIMELEGPTIAPRLSDNSLSNEAFALLSLSRCKDMRD